LTRAAGAAAVALIATLGLGHPSPAAAAGNNPAAYRLAAEVSATLGRCWFGAGEKAFAGYVHASETNAIVGPPRILIVKKNAPHARPDLVIEFRTEGSITRVNVYGPLIASDKATRIAADVNRWAAGGKECR
jgi:hypothetical protein